jgi:peptide deformylase
MIIFQGRRLAPRPPAVLMLTCLFRGMSAPQVGVPKRIIALNLGSGTFFIFNPEITDKSSEKFTLWDDCMSLPSVMVRVKRHKSISVRYKLKSPLL